MGKADWNKVFGECPEGFHDSVNSALNEISYREENKMSGFKIGKKAIITAAAVAVIGVTAVAAMKATSFTSHVYNNDAIYKIEEIQQKSNDTGMDVKYPESISDGYAFVKGYVVNGSADDENGNAIKQYESFELDYDNGKNAVSLFVDPVGDVSEIPTDKPSTDISGIKVYIFDTVYKFVPPDYEKTEQDIQDEKDGKITISYGSSEVEIKTMRQAMWKDGDNVFELLNIGGTVDEDVLKNMAKAIINE